MYINYLEFFCNIDLSVLSHLFPYLFVQLFIQIMYLISVWNHEYFILWVFIQYYVIYLVAQKLLTLPELVRMVLYTLCLFLTNLFFLELLLSLLFLLALNFFMHFGFLWGEKVCKRSEKLIQTKSIILSGLTNTIVVK